MFWFLLLLLLRTSFGWLHQFGADVIILDLALIGALFYLFRTNQVTKALSSWYFLKQRRHQRIKVHFNLAIASDFLRLLSLPFSIFWLMRWVEGYSSVASRMPSSREWTYLDVFIFCLASSSFIDAGKFGRLISRVKMTTGRQILIHYSFAVLIGAILLLLPTSLADQQSLSLVDGFFLAISALSVTGLAPVDISTVLSFPGQVILLILIQLGGLGIVLITAGFSLATFNRLSLNSILLGREMYSSCRVGDTPQFLAKVTGVTFLFEALGAASIYFALPPDTPDRFFSALFHSISAFCNAGFSLYTNNLQHETINVMGLSTICILIICGGLGYPILFDLGSAIRKRRLGRDTFSLHAKLTLRVMSLLLLAGTVFFFIFESLRPSANLDFWARWGQALFYSISSRTAGFAMVPVENFHLSALFFLVLLMAVGANPSSTGGGIKTTTIGVLLLAVYHTLIGSKQTVYKGRAIPTSTVARALTVVVLYSLISGLALTALVITEDASPFALGFEVISALSTVGLSMGTTANLSVFGKIVIMFLMLFGRIGILAILLAGLGHVSPSRVRYPEEDFFVG